MQYTCSFSNTIVDLLMLMPKILIVDDDIRLQSLLKRYLCDQGFVVETAGDGKLMTKKLAMSHFDLIVLDWIGCCRVKTAYRFVCA